jgi:hypothetical protein
MKTKRALLFLFLLTLSSCFFFRPDPTYFYIVRAQEGVFLSDYSENTGLLVLKELDPEVTAFIKDGKQEAERISIQELQDAVGEASVRNVAFLFYRDTNNNRLNIPLSFQGLEYNEETKELRVQIKFVAHTYQIEEIVLHNLTLFLS